MQQQEFNKNFKKQTLQNKLGIQLANEKIKQKVLEKIDLMYSTQERVLTQSSEGFIYKQAVTELRNEVKLFGAPKQHRVVVKSSIWPPYETFKITELEQFERESLLRDVKITRIEWTTIDTITSLRFTFSNGTSTI